ncbi:MAG: acetyl-CoA carboxylase biotin carboxyl carrier protein [Bacteroidales bacterium]
MRKYKIKINGNDYSVAIKNTDGNTAEIDVNGLPYQVEIERPVSTVSKTPKIMQVASVPSSESHQTTIKTGNLGSAGTIKSPLPGVILETLVREGDTVTLGQKIMVLEAMKMENSIEASVAGKVISIKVRNGESVLEGAELLTIG